MFQESNMHFFSIYDFIFYTAREKNDSIEKVRSFFKKHGITRSQLEQTKELPPSSLNKKVLDAVLSYLDLSVLELNLVFGNIPGDHYQSYFREINAIANLIEKKEDLKKFKVSVTKKVKPFYQTRYGELFKGDCLKLFRTIKNQSIDCIFADPPFNLDKKYDIGVVDKKSNSSYLSWCIAWLNESVRVLKEGGSLFIYNIPKWHTYLAGHLNKHLKFWNWIAVDMKFRLPIPNKLYPAHYSLLWYVKGAAPKTFNSQRIPMETCRFCGGELKDYGGYKNKMNPKGINVSDVWHDIYPVRHKNSKNRESNELPIKLVDRVISMSTKENDTVLDPFGGSGTTYVVCELLKRKWIGFEFGNCGLIKNRLLNRKRDTEILNNIYTEKHILFPPKVKKRRRKNDFWLDTDF